MGGTQSNNTSESLTQMSTKVAMSSILSCAGAATQGQILEFQNVVGDVTISNVSMTQASSVNMSCVMDSQKQSEIAGAVANTLAQFAQTQGQSVVSALGSTQSNVASKIKTQITNDISQTDSNQISTQISQSQKVSARNIGGNVVVKDLTMSQSAEIVAEALMKTSAYSTAINQVAAAVDQTTKTSEANFFAGIISSVGKAIGSMMATPAIIFGVVVIFGLIFLFIFLKIVGSTSKVASSISGNDDLTKLPKISSLLTKALPSISSSSSISSLPSLS